MIELYRQIADFFAAKLDKQANEEILGAEEDQEQLPEEESEAKEQTKESEDEHSSSSHCDVSSMSDSVCSCDTGTCSFCQEMAVLMRMDCEDMEDSADEADTEESDAMDVDEAPAIELVDLTGDDDDDGKTLLPIFLNSSQKSTRTSNLNLFIFLSEDVPRTSTPLLDEPMEPYYTTRTPTPHPSFSPINRSLDSQPSPPHHHNSENIPTSPFSYTPQSPPYFYDPEYTPQSPTYTPVSPEYDHDPSSPSNEPIDLSFASGITARENPRTMDFETPGPSSRLIIPLRSQDSDSSDYIPCSPTYYPNSPDRRAKDFVKKRRAKPLVYSDEDADDESEPTSSSPETGTGTQEGQSNLGVNATATAQKSQTEFDIPNCVCRQGLLTFIEQMHTCNIIRPSLLSSASFHDSAAQVFHELILLFPTGFPRAGAFDPLLAIAMIFQLTRLVLTHQEIDEPFAVNLIQLYDAFCKERESCTGLAICPKHTE